MLQLDLAVGRRLRNARTHGYNVNHKRQNIANNIINGYIAYTTCETRHQYNTIGGSTLYYSEITYAIPRFNPM